MIQSDDFRGSYLHDINELPVAGVAVQTLSLHYSMIVGGYFVLILVALIIALLVDCTSWKNRYRKISNKYYSNVSLVGKERKSILRNYFNEIDAGEDLLENRQFTGLLQLLLSGKHAQLVNYMLEQDSLRDVKAFLENIVQKCKETKKKKLDEELLQDEFYNFFTKQISTNMAIGLSPSMIYEESERIDPSSTLINIDTSGYNKNNTLERLSQVERFAVDINEKESTQKTAPPASVFHNEYASEEKYIHEELVDKINIQYTDILFNSDHNVTFPHSVMEESLHYLGKAYELRLQFSTPLFRQDDREYGDYDIYSSSNCLYIQPATPTTITQVKELSPSLFCIAASMISKFDVAVSHTHIHEESSVTIPFTINRDPITYTTEFIEMTYAQIVLKTKKNIGTANEIADIVNRLRRVGDAREVSNSEECKATEKSMKQFLDERISEIQNKANKQADAMKRERFHRQSSLRRTISKKSLHSSSSASGENHSEDEDEGIEDFVDDGIDGKIEFSFGKNAFDGKIGLDKATNCYTGIESGKGTRQVFRAFIRVTSTNLDVTKIAKGIQTGVATPGLPFPAVISLLDDSIQIIPSQNASRLVDKEVLRNYYQTAEVMSLHMKKPVLTAEEHDGVVQGVKQDLGEVAEEIILEEVEKREKELLSKRKGTAKVLRQPLQLFQFPMSDISLWNAPPPASFHRDSVEKKILEEFSEVNEFFDHELPADDCFPEVKTLPRKNLGATYNMYSNLRAASSVEMKEEEGGEKQEETAANLGALEESLLDEEYSEVPTTEVHQVNDKRVRASVRYQEQSLLLKKLPIPQCMKKYFPKNIIEYATLYDENDIPSAAHAIPSSSSSSTAVLTAEDRTFLLKRKVMSKQFATAYYYGHTDSNKIDEIELLKSIPLQYTSDSTVPHLITETGLVPGEVRFLLRTQHGISAVIHVYIRSDIRVNSFIHSLYNRYHFPSMMQAHKVLEEQRSPDVLALRESTVALQEGVLEQSGKESQEGAAVKRDSVRPSPLRRAKTEEIKSMLDNGDTKVAFGKLTMTYELNHDIEKVIGAQEWRYTILKLENETGSDSFASIIFSTDGVQLSLSNFNENCLFYNIFLCSPLIPFIFIPYHLIESLTFDRSGGEVKMTVNLWEGAIKFFLQLKLANNKQKRFSPQTIHHIQLTYQAQTSNLRLESHGQEKEENDEEKKEKKGSPPNLPQKIRDFIGSYLDKNTIPFFDTCTADRLTNDDFIKIRQLFMKDGWFCQLLNLSSASHLPKKYKEKIITSGNLSMNFTLSYFLSTARPDTKAASFSDKNSSDVSIIFGTTGFFLGPFEGTDQMNPLFLIFRSEQRIKEQHYAFVPYSFVAYSGVEQNTSSSETPTALKEEVFISLWGLLIIKLSFSLRNDDIVVSKGQKSPSYLMASYNLTQETADGKTSNTIPYFKDIPSRTWLLFSNLLPLLLSPEREIIVRYYTLVQRQKEEEASGNKKKKAELEALVEAIQKIEKTEISHPEILQLFSYQASHFSYLPEGIARPWKLFSFLSDSKLDIQSDIRNVSLMLPSNTSSLPLLEKTNIFSSRFDKTGTFSNDRVHEASYTLFPTTSPRDADIWNIWYLQQLSNAEQSSSILSGLNVFSSSTQTVADVLASPENWTSLSSNEFEWTKNRKKDVSREINRKISFGHDFEAIRKDNVLYDIPLSFSMLSGTIDKPFCPIFMSSQFLPIYNKQMMRGHIHYGEKCMTFVIPFLNAMKRGGGVIESERKSTPSVYVSTFLRNMLCVSIPYTEEDSVVFSHANVNVPSTLMQVSSLPLIINEKGVKRIPVEREPATREETDSSPLELGEVKKERALYETVWKCGSSRFCEESFTVRYVAPLRGEEAYINCFTANQKGLDIYYGESGEERVHSCPTTLNLRDKIIGVSREETQGEDKIFSEKRKQRETMFERSMEESTLHTPTALYHLYKHEKPLKQFTAVTVLRIVQNLTRPGEKRESKIGGENVKYEENIILGEFQLGRRLLKIHVEENSSPLPSVITNHLMNWQDKQETILIPFEFINATYFPDFSSSSLSLQALSEVLPSAAPRLRTFIAQELPSIASEVEKKKKITLNIEEGIPRVDSTLSSSPAVPAFVSLLGDKTQEAESLQKNQYINDISKGSIRFLVALSNDTTMEILVLTANPDTYDHLVRTAGIINKRAQVRFQQHETLFSNQANDTTLTLDSYIMDLFAGLHLERLVTSKLGAKDRELVSEYVGSSEGKEEASHALEMIRKQRSSAAAAFKECQLDRQLTMIDAKKPETDAHGDDKEELLLFVGDIEKAIAKEKDLKMRNKNIVGNLWRLASAIAEKGENSSSSEGFEPNKEDESLTVDTKDSNDMYKATCYTYWALLKENHDYYGKRLNALTKKSPITQEVSLKVKEFSSFLSQDINEIVEQDSFYPQLINYKSIFPWILKAISFFISEVITLALLLAYLYLDYNGVDDVENPIYFTSDMTYSSSIASGVTYQWAARRTINNALFTLPITTLSSDYSDGFEVSLILAIETIVLVLFNYLLYLIIKFFLRRSYYHSIQPMLTKIEKITIRSYALAINLNPFDWFYTKPIVKNRSRIKDKDIIFRVWCGVVGLLIFILGAVGFAIGTWGYQYIIDTSSYPTIYEYQYNGLGIVASYIILEMIWRLILLPLIQYLVAFMIQKRNKALAKKFFGSTVTPSCCTELQIPCNPSSNIHFMTKVSWIALFDVSTPCREDSLQTKKTRKSKRK